MSSQSHPSCLVWGFTLPFLPLGLCLLFACVLWAPHLIPFRREYPWNMADPYTCTARKHFHAHTQKGMIAHLLVCTYGIATGERVGCWLKEDNKQDAQKRRKCDGRSEEEEDALKYRDEPGSLRCVFMSGKRSFTSKANSSWVALADSSTSRVFGYTSHTACIVFRLLKPIYRGGKKKHT